MSLGIMLKAFPGLVIDTSYVGYLRLSGYALSFCRLDAPLFVYLAF